MIEYFLVTKVIDSTLFALETGELIKLKGFEPPEDIEYDCKQKLKELLVEGRTMVRCEVEKSNEKGELISEVYAGHTVSINSQMRRFMEITLEI